jgi:SAM-dependent methyltransferase
MICIPSIRDFSTSNTYRKMDHRQLFSQGSDLYARVRPQYPDELFEYLAACCQQHQAAWDGACGNGQAAIGLAGYFDAVYATDISQQQIANAMPHPKVTYSVQRSESTNFIENQFDLVCIAQALHWFDFDLFWPEVKRVLKPGGVFAAWGYTWFSVDEQVDRCLQEEFLKFLDPYWAEQNKLLWDHYQNVPFPFARLHPPNIEMKMEWDLKQLFGYLRSWSATRQWLEETGENQFQKAFQRTKSAWGDENLQKRVKMDFCLLVGRNRTRS